MPVMFFREGDLVYRRPRNFDITIGNNLKEKIPKYTLYKEYTLGLRYLIVPFQNNGKALCSIYRSVS